MPRRNSCYHLVWWVWSKQAKAWKSYELIRNRLPPHYNLAHKVVDLRTGNVVRSTLDLRQETEYVTREWPARTRALDRIAEEPQRMKEAKAKLEAWKLAHLVAQEKAWTRKLKLAQTKLRKLKRAIKHQRTKQQ